MNDRGLFIATMRKPVMRMVRAALRDLRREHNIDWRTSTKMEIRSFQGFYGHSWILLTDQYLSFCAEVDCKHPDFFVTRLHDR